MLWEIQEQQGLICPEKSGYDLNNFKFVAPSVALLVDSCSYLLVSNHSELNLKLMERERPL